MDFSHLPGLSVGLVVVRVVGVFVHLGGPPNFGQDAPGRICGQAIAQNHQGPLTLGVLRALALLLGLSWQQYLPVAGRAAKFSNATGRGGASNYIKAGPKR
jgi:hypothetical protein